MKRIQESAMRWAGPHLAWWLVVIVLSFTALVYWPTFADVWPRWFDDDSTTYRHGPIIALISAWLVFRARAVLREELPAPSILALPVALTLSVAWLVFFYGAVVGAYSVLWPVLAWTLVLAAAGWRTASRLIVPVGYLFFAMPTWDSINGIFQAATVEAVSFMTRLTDLPAAIRGNVISLPQGSFVIAEGCSGLHFLLVALATAVLAGEIHRDRWRTRLMLMVIATVLAVTSNWLRVYLIIYIGYATDMQHPLVQVGHYWFGWALFAVTMVVFFLLLRRMPAGAGASDTVRSVEAAVQVTQRNWARGAAAAIVAAIAAPLFSWATNIATGPAITDAHAAREISGFSGPLSASAIWQPRFMGVTGESRAAYLGQDGIIVDYYGNTYVEQRQGVELIGYGNQLFDEESFLTKSSRGEFIQTETGHVPVIEAQLETRSGKPWLALYYFDVDGRSTASERGTQVRIGLDSLWNATPAGVRAVAAPCAGDCNATRYALKSVLLGMTRSNP